MSNFRISQKSSRHSSKRSVDLNGSQTILDQPSSGHLEKQQYKSQTQIQQPKYLPKTPQISNREYLQLEKNLTVSNAFPTVNQRVALEAAMGLGESPNSAILENRRTLTVSKQMMISQVISPGVSLPVSSSSLNYKNMNSIKASPEKEPNSALETLFGSRLKLARFSSDMTAATQPINLFQTPKASSNNNVNNLRFGAIKQDGISSSCFVFPNPQSLNSSVIGNLNNGIVNPSIVINSNSKRLSTQNPKINHNHGRAISSNGIVNFSLDDKSIQRLEEIREKRDRLVARLKNEEGFAEVNSQLSQLLATIDLLIEEALKRNGEGGTQIGSSTTANASGSTSLLNRVIETEQQIHRLIGVIQNQINNAVSKSSQLQKDLSNKDQEIQSLREQFTDLISQLNGPKHSNESAEKEFAMQSNQAKKQNVQLVFENTKLIHTVKTLTEKLSNMQNDSEKISLESENSSLKVSIQQMKDSYEETLQKKEQLIAQNSGVIVNLRSFQKKAEQDIKYYKQYFEEQQERTKRLTEENELLEETTGVLRNRFNMLLEDFNSRHQTIHDLNKNLVNSSLKIKKLQERIDRVTLAKSTYVDVPENGEFEEEKRFFSSIQYIYSKNLYFVKQCRILISGIDQTMQDKNAAKYDTSNNNNNSQGENTQGNSEEQYVKLAAYKYALPTFFVFIESTYSHMTTELGEAPKIPFIFIATLRGILDSKFNEYSLNMNSTHTMSSFPDFLYSWIATFQIDKFTRTIIQLDKTTQNETVEQKLSHFYLLLHNPLLSKLWEVITFREFLNEDLSQEEVYFYLFCRHQLFKGPQLNMIQSTFEIVNYIDFIEAEGFVRQIMSKFDVNAVEYMVNQLRTKCVVKMGNALIDAQVVLRILLEYLRTERMQRYKLIKALFYSQKSDEKQAAFSLNFQSFKNIFDGNFPHTTELEKARIYRECHCVGKGIVNHDGFFLVCNENGFFTRQLKLKIFENLPSYNEKANSFHIIDINNTINPTQNALLQQMDQFCKFLNEDKSKEVFKELEGLLEELGQEVLIKRYLLFREKVDNFNSKMIPSDLKGRDYLFYLHSELHEISNGIFLKFSNEAYQQLHKLKIIQQQQIVNSQQQQVVSKGQPVLKVQQSQSQQQQLQQQLTKQQSKTKQIQPAEQVSDNIIIQKSIEEQFINLNYTMITTILENRKNVTAYQQKKLSVFQLWIRKKISKWYNLLNSILIGKLLKMSGQKLLTHIKTIDTSETQELKEEQEG